MKVYETGMERTEKNEERGKKIQSVKRNYNLIEKITR